MIPGILAPGGNLGALCPQQTLCTPIAAVAVAVGDLVQFDLTGTSTTYTDTTTLSSFDFDNKKSPFNVVILSVASSAANTNHAGIYGVVTKAAAAGQRCTVCIAGLVDAKVQTVTTTNVTTAGNSTCVNGTGVLLAALTTSAAATNGAPLAIPFTTVTTSTTTTMKVLLKGFAFAVGGA